jgi:hypothetical protein
MLWKSSAFPYITRAVEGFLRPESPPRQGVSIGISLTP